MIEIPGDYLEGGGQILRTALALSCITQKSVRIFNIRAKRREPGLKSQHLYTLKALADLFKAKVEGINIGSRQISFIPSDELICQTSFEIDLKTAGAIGLALQPLILVSAFRSQGVCFNLKGGTSGLGAVPVDYYSYVIFPLLERSGVKADLKVKKRGYYPKGGGEISVEIKPIKESREIYLVEPGKPLNFKIISIASQELSSRQVAERQAQKAEAVLKDRFSLPTKTEIKYTKTYSIGSEINLICYTQNSILWADARGEKRKSAEDVGREAGEKLIKEIESYAGVDVHLADNLIPWLAFLGGKIKTSSLSLHTRTNIWVCELFLGKIFQVNDTTIISSTDSCL